VAGAAGSALGIAQAAIDAFAELATKKTPSYTATMLKDRPIVQLRFATAVAKVESARAYLHEAFDAAWQGALDGRSLDLAGKARLPRPNDRALDGSGRRTGRPELHLARHRTRQARLLRPDARVAALQVQGLPARHLPCGDETTRYLPDKLPIGIEKDGFQRHVFLYLMTRDVPVDFRLFLLRHAELLRTVPQFTVRLLVPRRFRKSTSLYRFAFRELAMPVDPTTADQLQAYFRHRQQARGHFTEPGDEDLGRAP
jgi:hypothetical protein